MDLTSHITHSNVYAPYIAYYRSNGIHQLFRKLKPKPKLNPPNAHRSQIKICVSNVSNVPNVPNAFRILKPIQKSSKRVWVFRNTGASAFAKNQMRLAYEDKRDLYCRSQWQLRQVFIRSWCVQVGFIGHMVQMMSFLLISRTAILNSKLTNS